MNMKDERNREVAATIDRVKAIDESTTLNRSTLAQMLEALKQLASRKDLWETEEFPPPERGVRQARYLIREDDNKAYALYLNVMRRGNRTPVHNHTTWA